MQNDFNPDNYVQPNGLEALKYKDGAKVLDCNVCGRSMLLPVESQRTTCTDCGELG
ncbi:MAG TPA: hypothetical protein VFE36_07905 [Candidatus Baltobacteraceae bacterium]|jgi:hypothetical protein|nr:hypothetical protein [Candidatus Baltobacteraceae bacterium]